MDAPLAEELELLESAFSEDDCVEDFEEDVAVEEIFHDGRKRSLNNEIEAWPEIASEEKRQRKDAPVESTVDSANDFVIPEESPRDDVDEMFLWRFASEIEGECVPVTGSRGERMYAKISASAVGSGVKESRTERSESLLSEPIRVLLEKVEHEALIKALQESSTPAGDADDIKTLSNEQLWVEKYAPKSFTELLSNEQTNREVLLWLKQWDSCVFGSHVRATSDDVLSALRRHHSVVKSKKIHDNKRSFGRNQSMDDETTKPFGTENGEDSSVVWNIHSKTSHGSPQHKVLLLCGPPGLGKTTLAHVAAKHCGYRVVEINASDDRSSSTIESKILDVVQMNSVSSDSRPKCLVIDEIDGALGEGKGAVDVILKMIAADKRSSGHKDSSSNVETGKTNPRKKSPTALSRPVICICNDLYAPALRSLRQVAKVHMFIQPAVSRVVNRLKYICRREGYKTNSIALTTLAEYTECDIRSCLNTLQFLNKKKENLNVLEVSSQVVGRKDVSRSAFDVWKEVFHKKSKRDRKSTRGGESGGDFKSLDSLISNRGEYELTMDGIHENFLHLSFHDPLMHKTVGCLDALGVSDCLFRYIMRTQKMALQAYQPLNAIAICRLVAQAEKPTIEWPKSYFRFQGTLIERKETLKSWLSGISPSISRHLSCESVVEDLVSPLLYILSPKTLRPVAMNLLSEKEKEELDQVVDIMVSYCINYKNQSKSNESYSESSLGFNLDPPIDGLINFKDYCSGLYSLALPMKQIVAHEVEKQRILSGSMQARLTAEGGQTIKPKTMMTSSSSSSSSSINPQKDIKKTPAIDPPKKTQPRDSPKPPTNFFDRFRKASSVQRAEPSGKADASRRHPLLFKYNEGFTNAVKRPIRLRELLLP